MNNAVGKKNVSVVVNKLLSKVRPLLFFLLVAGGGVGAAESHVRVALLAEPAAVSAGMPFWVAVRLDHDPGWHTYYREPGDSGYPTEIDWDLPEGFSAGPIQWPVPQRIELPPLVNFGYEGEASLLVLISPPDRISDKNLILKARVSWLECQEACVPGKTDVSLSLPVSPAPVLPLAEMSLYFDQARASLENTDPLPTAKSGLNIGLALLLAFLGGALLNLMPCVLPVLSIKFLGFLETPRETLRKQGLLYGAGVLISFLALAGLLIFLRAGGEKLGWGFQLQSPLFVGFLAALFLVLGLNLWGAFEVGTSFTRLGGLLGGKSSANAFFSGTLAVLVATPCTAPFMGSALGFALTQPAGVSLAIFGSMGVGMALPYVGLSFFPRALRWIPKPGPWMITLKKALSVLLFATCLWLLWVLAMQIRPSSAGASYSQAKVDAFVADGKPVFVDFTAAWCITCQVNERTTLSSEKVQKAFQENGVTVLVADWTNRDPEISTALERFGRNGVPLYVLYYPGREPVVLPALLTPEIVIQEIEARRAPPQSNNTKQ
jgi:cytochrome c biogenesis protein CcdA